MIKLYVANLGKYNEGNLVGNWIELPKSEDEIKQFLSEQVGINEQYEEWAIHDYEKDIDGLKIGEYDNIYELNELAQQMEDLDENQLKALSAFLQDGCKIEDAIEHVNNGDYFVFSDCNDMSDVAYQYIDETGVLNNVPEQLQNYFDYEAYGRDMELEGTFYSVDNDYIQLTY